MADQSFAVLGLGKFGMALTVALLKAEQDVLVIDSNEEVINDVAHLVTHAVIADATDEDELRDLVLSIMFLSPWVKTSKVALSQLC